MTAGGNVYARIAKFRPARFAVLDRSKEVWQKVVGDPSVRTITRSRLKLVNNKVAWRPRMIHFIAARPPKAI